MAYGHTDISATELANMALDKPLLGANVIPAAPTLERWNHEGTVSGADHTATGYPIARLHDADPELLTKPDSALQYWYVVYNFGTTVSVDFCAVGPGHNFGTVGLTGFWLEFDQNQDGAFSAVDSCPLLSSFPAPDDDRILQLELKPGGAGTAQRFLDVQYCRFKMAKVGSTATPQITELFIGARWQAPRWPNMSFNPNNLNDLSETADPTKGGSIDKIITAENQLVIDGAEWTLKEDETTDLRAWWKKTRGSFVWVWLPSTAPASFNLMVRDTDRLDLPYDGWKKTTFTISGIEQGPESKYLENE